MDTWEIKKLEDCMRIVSRLYDDSKKPSSNSFVAPCETVFPLGLWFRGEEDSGKTTLIPSVFRPLSDGRYFDETRLFNFARARFPQEYKTIGGSHGLFQSLVFMQHYGVPTRLLDWTESVATALFFAVERTDSSQDGKLFVLNARKLNSVAGFEKGDRNIHDETSYGTVFRSLFCEVNTKYQWYTEAHKFGRESKDLSFMGTEFDWRHPTMPDRLKNEINSYRDSCIPCNAISFLTQPVAVLPGLLHARLRTQHGAFTLHGGKMYSSNSTVEKCDRIDPPCSLSDLNNKQGQSEKFLLTFTIPKADKRRIKQELLALGVHAGSLYPETDKQGDYIKELFA